MNIFDNIILDLRPGEYVGTRNDVFLAPHVERLLSSVQLNWRFRATDRSVEMNFPNRNARFVLQVLRRFPSLLTCGYSDGEEIFEFLRLNGTGEIVAAGTVGDAVRGLIYCSVPEDAFLVKLRFQNVRVIECKPEKFDGRFNAAYECTPAEIAQALGEDVNHA